MRKVRRLLKPLQDLLQRIRLGVWLGKLGKGLLALAGYIRQLSFKSMGTKFFLGFVVSNVIFVSVVGLFSYSISKGIVHDKVANASNETIKQAGGKFDLLFAQYGQLATELTIDTVVQEDLTKLMDNQTTEYDKIQTKDALHDFLSRKSNADKSITNITIVDMNGEKQATSQDRINLTSDVVSQVIHNAQDGKEWLITATKSYSESTEPTFGIAKVISDIQSGDPLGVCMIEFRASALAEEIGKITLGDTGKVHLLSPEQVVIASADKAEWSLPYANQLPGDLMTVDNSNMTLEVAGQGEMLVQSYKSPINGWVIVGMTPMAELVNAADRILLVTINSLWIAAVSAAIIGFLMARRISRPLAALSKLMSRGESGDLNIRAGFKRQDEIGVLGASFDRMMAQIQLLVQETSQSVIELHSKAQEIMSASKATATSAREIAISTEEIANGAAGLSYEADLGNRLSIELGRNMILLKQSNDEMSGSAGEVQRASEQGAKFMSKLTQNSTNTETQIRLMADNVTKLKNSTSSIQKILDVLTTMTKQTNILSLNASIEASRSGAAGKGFMVIAEEIRKLAEQSKKSIDLVGGIIHQIHEEVDLTLSSIQDVFPVFEEQVQAVRDTEHIFGQVETRMDGFIHLLGTVTAAIQHLDESQHALRTAMTNVSMVAQESSASSQEVASLCEEQLNVGNQLEELSEKLDYLSLSLKKSIDKFTY